ncbi:MAG: DUF2378 family protein [Myxococcales bacterium]|nr:DUF2378 family protein [Myxococcales bacterium]
MNDQISKTQPERFPPGAAMTLRFDRDDLEQRLLQATTNDTCKGMFFNGLFLAVNHTAGEPGLERLKAAAPARKFVDFFNYPITEFLPIAWLAAEIVGGGATPAHLERGIKSIGKQATNDFLATAVGKTLLLLSGNEPRRLMNSLASGYKTAVSYGLRVATWHEPSRCTFTMRRDFMPHAYHEGVMEQVLTVVGGKDVQVTGARVGLLDADYEISWR